MSRSYRIPHPILTAAHAMGMGLLRPAGMLTGMTHLEDWEAIGYQIKTPLILGKKITLHRPPDNSPNPIPKLWQSAVLEF